LLGTGIVVLILVVKVVVVVVFVAFRTRVEMPVVVVVVVLDVVDVVCPHLLAVASESRVPLFLYAGSQSLPPHLYLPRGMQIRLVQALRVNVSHRTYRQ
jgi:hypothetical protein